MAKQQEAKEQEAKEQEAAGRPSEEAEMKFWSSAPCLTTLQSRIPAPETVPPHSG